MDLDKIKQINEQALSNENKAREEKQNCREELFEILSRFPSEDSIITKSLEELQTIAENTQFPEEENAYLEIVHLGFVFNDNKPTNTQTVMFSDEFWYILDEDHTLTQRCAYSSIIFEYNDETALIRVPIQTDQQIRLNDEEFAQFNQAVKLLGQNFLSNTRSWTNGLTTLHQEYLCARNSKLEKIFKKNKMIVNDCFPRDSIRNIKGRCYKIKFYTELSDEGVKTYLRNELEEKIQYHSVCASLVEPWVNDMYEQFRNLNLDSPLQELLEDTATSAYVTKECPKLNITFKLETSLALDDVPNVTWERDGSNILIKHIPMKLFCSLYGKTVQVGTIAPQSVVSVEMSDVFWRWTEKVDSEHVAFVLYIREGEVIFDNVFNSWHVARIVRSIVQDTGLTVIDYKGQQDFVSENGGYACFTIIVKNPFYREE